MCVYMCVCVYIHTHTYTHEYVSICVYIYVYIHIHTHECVYICVYIHIHTHIHTCIGAYTYMCMYTGNPSYNETKKADNFFRSRNVPFNTDTLSWDPPNCKTFPLQTGFRYAQNSV
jgi:hypothetical protein